METIKGIIIKVVRYKDNAHIVRIFTDQHGILSGMVRLGSSKSGSFRHVCRVMNMVEFDCAIHESRDLQQFNHLRLAYPVLTIPFDPTKSALILYLGELLSKTLPDQYHNRPLFKFLHDAILLLDDSEHIHNFHLWCTTEIIRHYGFYPELPLANKPYTCFDFMDNVFMQGRPPHPYHLDEAQSQLLYHLLDKDWSEIQTLPTQGQTRKGLLEGLLQMINLHLELKASYHSLEVLHQVFHD